MENHLHNSNGYQDSQCNLPQLSLKRDGGEVFINISGKWRLSCPERPELLKKWRSFLRQTSKFEIFNVEKLHQGANESDENMEFLYLDIDPLMEVEI